MRSSQSFIVNVGGVDDESRQKSFISLEHTGGSRLEPERDKHLSGGSFERRTAEQWTNRNDRGGFDHRRGHAWYLEDGPDGQRRVGGGDDNQIGVRDGVEEARRRLGSSDAIVCEGSNRVPVAAANEVILEGKPGAVFDLDPGPDWVICRGHHSLAYPEGCCDLCGDFRQGYPPAQRISAEKTCCEISVTETERGIDATVGEGIHYRERVVADSPSLGSRNAGQGVGDRVEIRRYVRTVHIIVVAYVDDYRQSVWCDSAGQRSSHTCATNATT